MRFRTVKDSIVNNVLGPAEAGRFVTVGFQRQSTSADEVLDTSRIVQVYFSEGDFGKPQGRRAGPTQHDITYHIELTVSKAAEGDLSIINSPTATQGQISAAILAFQEAADLADQSIDELIDIVYQILMDARSIDLGMVAGEVSNRWVTDIKKNQPVPQGEYVILTASMALTCRVAEDVTGEAGVAQTGKPYLTVVDLDGDNNEKTAKQV